MQVHAGMLVLELQERLTQQTGWAADSFYLLGDGHRLADQRSLGAAGIGRDYTVRAKGRLEGGARPAPAEEDIEHGLYALGDARLGELLRELARLQQGPGDLAVLVLGHSVGLVDTELLPLLERGVQSKPSTEDVHEFVIALVLLGFWWPS